MKAIITQSSEFPKLNGLTLEVACCLSSTVAFIIDGNLVEMPFNEVFIVDIQAEYNHAVALVKAEQGEGHLEEACLELYIKAKGINVTLARL
jgi:hypothetical protein